VTFSDPHFLHALQLACRVRPLTPRTMMRNLTMLSRQSMEPSTHKTLGEHEAEISQAFIRFEKEFMGRGPLEAKSYILDDLVMVRLKGVLTPSEIKLAELSDRPRARYLLKQVRQELLEHGRPAIETIIRDILGVEMRSLHTDISTKTGERIIVMTLAEKPAIARRALADQ
jgi:uncharacterized protein YbcI